MQGIQPDEAMVFFLFEHTSMSTGGRRICTSLRRRVRLEEDQAGRGAPLPECHHPCGARPWQGLPSSAHDLSTLTTAIVTFGRCLICRPRRTSFRTGSTTTTPFRPWRTWTSRSCRKRWLVSCMSAVPVIGRTVNVWQRRSKLAASTWAMSSGKLDVRQ